MTTQVNITVGGEGLQQRLSAEATANRHRQLNAARDNALAAKAQSANTADAAVPTIYASPRRANRPEPAATRQGYPVAMARTQQFSRNYYITPLEGPEYTFLIAEEVFTNTLPVKSVPGGNYDPSGYYESYSVFDTDQIQNDIELKIPVNKDTMICVYFRTWRRYEWLLPYPPANLQGGSGVYSAFLHWAEYLARTGEYRFDFRAEYNSLPERRERTAEYSICVVVNKKSARAIPMPSQLKAKLRAATYQSYTPPTPTTRDIIQNGELRRYITLPGGARGPEPAIGNLGGLFHLGLAGANLFDVTGYSDNSEYLLGTPSIFTWLANPLSSYDITPATYSISDPPATINARYWQPDNKTDNADGSVTLKLPYTTRKVTQISNFNDYLEPWLPRYKANGYTKVNVPASFDLYGPVHPELNRNYRIFEGINVDILSLTWDWGRPGYCREQLYALGFTAADLTP